MKSIFLLGLMFPIFSFALDLPRNLGLPSEKPRGILFYSSDDSDPTLPSKWNWHNQDGLDWMTSVREQNNCGSCVAMGGISTLEAQLKIDAGLPFWNPLLSVQSLFACGGGDCSAGWTVQSAAQHMKDVGVPDDSCSPYIGKSGAPACQAQCTDAASRTIKIQDFIQPTNGTIDETSIKRALMRGPVWTTMAAYFDFLQYRWGVYKHSEGEFWAGHTLAIIGYDDSKKAWLVKNSWGDKWGENGYGMIHYKDISGLGAATWQLILPKRDGYASIERSSDKGVYSGVVEFKLRSSRKDTTQMQLQIFDKNSVEIRTLNCDGSECSVSFDSSEFADGQYELLPALLLGSKTFAGVRSSITIDNSKKAPQLFASRRSKAQGDEDHSINFDVSAGAWGKLVAELWQGSKLILRQETTDVRPRMLVRLDPEVFPEGKYVLKIVGANSKNASASHPIQFAITNHR